MLKAGTDLRIFYDKLIQYLDQETAIFLIVVINYSIGVRCCTLFCMVNLVTFVPPISSWLLTTVNRASAIYMFLKPALPSKTRPFVPLYQDTSVTLVVVSICTKPTLNRFCAYPKSTSTPLHHREHSSYIRLFCCKYTGHSRRCYFLAGIRLQSSNTIDLFSKNVTLEVRFPLLCRVPVFLPVESCTRTVQSTSALEGQYKANSNNCAII